MTESVILEYMAKAILLVLVLSMPPVIVASVTGILLSLLQALTQLQEQTVQFAVKLVVTVLTLLATARWLGIELYNYALTIFTEFPYVQF
jgi:type III secretion protein S